MRSEDRNKAGHCAIRGKVARVDSALHARDCSLEQLAVVLRGRRLLKKSVEYRRTTWSNAFKNRLARHDETRHNTMCLMSRDSSNVCNLLTIHENFCKRSCSIEDKRVFERSRNVRRRLENRSVFSDSRNIHLETSGSEILQNTWSWNR